MALPHPAAQEYADGSDLFTLLHKYGGRLSERLAVQMVLDPFLRVLHYLHTRAIIHRDIKVRLPCLGGKLSLLLLPLSMTHRAAAGWGARN